MISLADVVAAEIHRRASNPPPLPPQNGTRSATTHSHVLIDRPPHGHLPSDGADGDESNGGSDGGAKGRGGIARAASSASMDGGGIARGASSASLGERQLTVPVTLQPPPPPPPMPPVAEFYNTPIFVHTSDETGLTMAGVQAGPVGRGEVQMFDLDGVRDGLWVSQRCSGVTGHVVQSCWMYCTWVGELLVYYQRTRMYNYAPLSPLPHYTPSQAQRQHSGQANHLESNVASAPPPPPPGISTDNVGPGAGGGGGSGGGGMSGGHGRHLRGDKRNNIVASCMSGDGETLLFAHGNGWVSAA